MDYSSQIEFINHLRDIKDYWCEMPNLDKEEVKNGIMHSILTLIDGDSSINDCHPYELIDSETGKEVTNGYLHEFLAPEMAGKNEFVEALKINFDYWFDLNQSIEKQADGAIFSTLVMLDGDSGSNDFHSYEITDEITGERIDCGYLHELMYLNERQNIEEER